MASFPGSVLLRVVAEVKVKLFPKVRTKNIDCDAFHDTCLVKG
jgi:hypothetical protein